MTSQWRLSSLTHPPAVGLLSVPAPPVARCGSRRPVTAALTWSSCSKVKLVQATAVAEVPTASPEPVQPISSEHIQSLLQGPNVLIQTIASLSQMQEVARLRAEAYYEDERSRFVESFKKQFVAQEVESLQKRTAPGARGAPQADCLVAIQPESDREVVGCIDIRLPYVSTEQQPAGVPVEDPQGAYILNVVVHEDHRGQGIGRALMLAAMQRAVQTWRAGTLYTHVEADNEVAYRLYTRCGFEEHSSEAKFSNTASLGRLVLLQVSAAQVAIQ